MDKIHILHPIFYENIYNWVLLVCIFFIFLKSFSPKPERTQLLAYTFFIFSIFFIGYRPIGYWFGDMGTYNLNFIDLQNGIPIKRDSDLLFVFFSKFCSYFMSANTYFLTICVIYIFPLYLFGKKHLKTNWGFIFFAFVASFSFFTYGTNGLRNGIATSLFILGLTYFEKKTIMWSIFAIAFGFHNSMILPIIAYGLTFLINKPKFYLFIWFACVPFSLIAGNGLQELVAGLGFEERTAGYLTGGEEYQSSFSSTGFRWDFLLYSFVPIYTGYFYIVNMKIKDKLYYSIFGIYTITNAFWVLIIRANFSNRFAYLSWFLMAIVIFYPLYKYKMFKNQYTIAALVMIAYFAFTFFMNVIL